MFKISEFSKLSQVSIKTLRYYDQLGLLKPAYTDQFSGYRYFSAEQMFQIHRILAFKELGFSLEQIRQMMDENIPLEHIRGMFRVKQNEIQSILEKEQAKLFRIKESLRTIEYERKDLSSLDVVLKEIKSQHVISYRKQTSLSEIPEMFRQLDQYIGSPKPHSLSQMVLWHGCEECEDEIDIEVARPLTIDLPSHPFFTIKKLPEITMMATLVHHCSTINRCTASTELALWIERNGYRLKNGEPRREICIPHEKVDDPEFYVAEVQIAVEKASN
ncbi:MerR family transcriptional regulator [Lysinibacillus sp. NPDC047702]|uniref:MerR family transcriptional regulator n=1 Tax=unclassified Lysinibacillus TaxID=2636778 RepID=UPI003D06F35F